MTVKELRDALADVDGRLPVAIWLPGSRIDLTNVMGVMRRAHSTMPYDDECLIEGSVRPGSVFKDWG